MKKEKRFVTIYREDGVLSGKEIFADKETGVNYLCVYEYDSCTNSITPLLDKDGKPVVTSASELED